MRSYLLVKTAVVVIICFDIGQCTNIWSNILEILSGNIQEPLVEAGHVLSELKLVGIAKDEPQPQNFSVRKTDFSRTPLIRTQNVQNIYQNIQKDYPSQRVLNKLGHGFSGVDICADRGECFSGAWFTHSDHIITCPGLIQLEKHKKKMFYQPVGNSSLTTSSKPNKRKKVPCEDGSYYLFHQSNRKRVDPNPWGLPPHQTIDVLDFSVMHLSAGER